MQMVTWSHANLNEHVYVKIRSLKDNTKAKLKGPENDMKKAQNYIGYTLRGNNSLVGCYNANEIK